MTACVAAMQGMLARVPRPAIFSARHARRKNGGWPTRETQAAIRHFAPIDARADSRLFLALGGRKKGHQFQPRTDFWIATLVVAQ